VTLRHLSVAALCVLACVAEPAAASALSAAVAPTQTARSGAQRFGYRSIGRGRPVVFIQGLSGTIDGWPPSFLDKVAARGHRVIVFDNEGIGRSTLRPGTLTVRRMAQDAARLIRALRLERPDVVGWSMGGMIAQSLAVRSPRLVRRLVLLATAPGDGKAVAPEPAAEALLASGDVAGLLGELFPEREVATRDRYIADLLRRFDFMAIARPAVVEKQLAAARQWMEGEDPDGARAGGIRARALVGAGAQDRLLPVANQRHLAELIPHSRLVTYADSAHGFFFQHDRDFARRMAAFLR
jgi:pimeloyl-ACP methyl ester carboxylesterase